MPPSSAITTTGTVSDWKPNAVAVKVDIAPAPIRHTFTKTTTYVDENGNPVSPKSLTKGTPVTIFYEQNGDEFMATRVILRNPAVLDR